MTTETRHIEVLIYPQDNYFVFERMTPEKLSNLSSCEDEMVHTIPESTVVNWEKTHSEYEDMCTQLETLYDKAIEEQEEENG